LVAGLFVWIDGVDDMTDPGQPSNPGSGRLGHFARWSPRSRWRLQLVGTAALIAASQMLVDLHVISDWDANFEHVSEPLAIVLYGSLTLFLILHGIPWAFAEPSARSARVIARFWLLAKVILAIAAVLLCGFVLLVAYEEGVFEHPLIRQALVGASSVLVLSLVLLIPGVGPWLRDRMGTRRR